KRHADARQPRKGIGRILAMWIHYGDRARELRAWFVVIRDHNVDSRFARLFHLVVSLNPAVAGDDQLRAILLRSGDKGAAQVVAVLLAMGDVDVHVGSQLLKKTGPESRRGHAIAVIISVDVYLLMALQSD